MSSKANNDSGSSGKMARDLKNSKCCINYRVKSPQWFTIACLGFAAISIGYGGFLLSILNVREYYSGFMALGPIIAGVFLLLTIYIGGERFGVTWLIVMLLIIATLASVSSALLNFVGYSETVTELQSSRELEGLGELNVNDYSIALFNACCVASGAVSQDASIVSCSANSEDLICIIDEQNYEQLRSTINNSTCSMLSRTIVGGVSFTPNPVPLVGTTNINGCGQGDISFFQNAWHRFYVEYAFPAGIVLTVVASLLFFATLIVSIAACKVSCTTRKKMPRMESEKESASYPTGMYVSKNNMTTEPSATENEQHQPDETVLSQA